MINTIRGISCICLLAISASLPAQNIAPKPLYDDPVYHGAADPVIIYNKQKKWWMLYTNRRASINDSTVQWVHGRKDFIFTGSPKLII